MVIQALIWIKGNEDEEPLRVPAHVSMTWKSYLGTVPHRYLEFKEGLVLGHLKVGVLLDLNTRRIAWWFPPAGR